MPWLIVQGGIVIGTCAMFALVAWAMLAECGVATEWCSGTTIAMGWVVIGMAGVAMIIGGIVACCGVVDWSIDRSRKRFWQDYDDLRGRRAPVDDRGR